MNLQPPSWLSERACEVFLETVAALGNKCLPSDCSAIADFAQAQADCEQWSVEVRVFGETLVSDKGNTYTNPLYGNLQARRKDLERYRTDLGMTPKSRKVTVTATPKAGVKDAMKAR